MKTSNIPVGSVFGKLTTLENSTLTEAGRRMIRVSCSCGVQKVIRADFMLAGKVVSCGCHRDAQNAIANKSHGFAGKGKARHPMYQTWSSMVQRMTNPKNPAFQFYGGRGLQLEMEWLNFDRFREAMEGTWFPGATLERVNTLKGYGPDNCTWIPRARQQDNTRRTLEIHWEGAVYSVGSMADLLKISPGTLRCRLRVHADKPVSTIIQAIRDKTYLPRTNKDPNLLQKTFRKYKNVE